VRTPKTAGEVQTIPTPMFLTDVGYDSPVTVRAEARAPAAENFPKRHKVSTIIGVSVISTTNVITAKITRKPDEADMKAARVRLLVSLNRLD
jgi:hypothetical protein